MNQHIKSLRAKYKAIDDSGDAEIEARIPLLTQLLIDHAWSQMQDVLDDLMSDLGHPYPGAAARQITDSLANQSQHFPHGQPSRQYAEAWLRHFLGVRRQSEQKNLPNDSATDARLRQEFNELRDDIIERIQGDLDYPECWTNYDRDSPPVRHALQRVRAARSPKELLDVITASDAIMEHYNDMRLCGSNFDIVRELNRVVEQW